MHFFSPAYSPDMKPIEKGFSQIKRWLRHHENEALLQSINKCFNLYSTTAKRGARGCKII